ncbi:MAG TPA: sodium:solute symporter family protein [Streptosporangiaceae bacterium]|jgi:SSS family solute:Na+ symporter
MDITVFVLIIAASLALALGAKFGVRQVDIGQYLVGGRAFSGFLLFFLSVGEIYSIGAMIAFPGGIYAEGASYGVWFLGYILLAYPIGYFVGPLLWRAGKRYDAMTMPDVLRSHYRSRTLEILASIAAIGYMIPWAQYQFAGLQVALAALGFHIGAAGTVVLSVAIALAYVLITGLRAPAMVSILKDLVMFAAIVVVGIVAAVSIGGVGKLFDGAVAGGATVTMSGKPLVYALSTILLQAPTFYLGVSGFTLVVAARSERTIKRTFIAQPLYMLMYPPLVLASYYALAELKVSDPNLAFTAATHAVGSPWLVGLAAGAAALSGFLLLAVLSLGFGAIISRNIVPNMRQDRQRRSVGVCIVAFLLVSALLAVTLQGLMLNILTFAYVVAAQIVPAWLATLFSRRTTKTAICAGIIVGLVLGLGLQAFGLTELAGINIGLIVLVVNAVVTFTVDPVRRMLGAASDDEVRPIIRRRPTATSSSPRT